MHEMSDESIWTQVSSAFLAWPSQRDFYILRVNLGNGSKH